MSEKTINLTVTKEELENILLACKTSIDRVWYRDRPGIEKLWDKISEVYNKARCEDAERSLSKEYSFETGR